MASKHSNHIDQLVLLLRATVYSWIAWRWIGVAIVSALGGKIGVATLQVDHGLFEPSSIITPDLEAGAALEVVDSCYGGATPSDKASRTTVPETAAQSSN